MKVVIMILAGLAGVAVVVAISFLLALPVKWCWNYAIAPTTGAGEMGFWQAWCLSFLMGMVGRNSSCDCKSSS